MVTLPQRMRFTARQSSRRDFPRGGPTPKGVPAMEFGTCTVRAHYEGDTMTLEVLQADDTVEVSADLAADHGIGREGGRLTITDDVAYDLTDWTPFTEDGRTGDTFIGTLIKD